MSNTNSNRPSHHPDNASPWEDPVRFLAAFGIEAELVETRVDPLPSAA